MHLTYYQDTVTTLVLGTSSPSSTCSCQVCFFDNLCYHPGLIHVTIKLIVVRDVDTHEFLVRAVHYCILVLVEVLDEGIPIVCDVFRSEPTKVVAVGDDEDGLTIYPLVE